VFFFVCNSNILEFLFPKFWGVRRDLIHLLVVEIAGPQNPKFFVAESESLGRKRELRRDGNFGEIPLRPFLEG